MDVDFRVLFESAPGLYLVLKPDFTIVAVSDAYLKATMTSREEILGRNLFDVFPDNPDDPEATGVRNLSASLNSVIATRAPHTMAVQKYDVRRPNKEGGTFEAKYWSPVNSPVIGPDNEVIYIIHRAEDVTEYVRLKQEELQFSKTTEQFKEQFQKMEAEIFSRGKELQERSQELEELNKELQITRDDAIIASQVKSAFIASVSHELRTPLGAILGISELMLDGDDLTDEYKEFSKVIHDAGKALLALVNDVLDLSKIEAGKMSLDLRQFNPAAIAGESVYLLKATAASKGLEIHLELANDIPDCVLGDPSRIQQIILNLLGNAIKFTDAGKVALSVTVQAQMAQTTVIRFSVVDTGIGIAEDQQSKLFQPFSQIKTRKNYGGTGLGLTISKRLVELMHGQMGLESSPQAGSTFWFSIPFEHSKQLLLATDSPNRVIELARGKRILVVEDQLVMQSLARNQMLNLGLECDITGSAEEALSKLGDIDYDLILMDCHLPMMDGIEATSVIRARELELQKTRVPIIAMTAGAMKGDREKCLSAGMDDFLSKPYSLKELQEKLHTWLSKDENESLAV